MNDSSSFQKPLSIPSLILGVCFILGMSVGGYAYFRAQSTDRVISVTGSADRVITSDTVKWSSNFSRNVDAEALKDGSKQLIADLDVIKKLFKDRGVKNEEMTVQPMTVTPVCEASQNQPYYSSSGVLNCGTAKIAGYTLQQQLLVESSDVKGVTKLAQEAPATLIDRGISFASVGTEYYYGKLNEAKLEMLQEATKNATERARNIAESTGAHLGSLQDASMGVFQVTAVHSTDISDYGTYDTSSIDKRLTSIVRTSYLLK